MKETLLCASRSGSLRHVTGETAACCATFSLIATAALRPTWAGKWKEQAPVRPQARLRGLKTTVAAGDDDGGQEIRQRSGLNSLGPSLDCYESPFRKSRARRPAPSGPANTRGLLPRSDGTLAQRFECASPPASLISPRQQRRPCAFSSSSPMPIDLAMRSSVSQFVSSWRR